VTASRHVSAVIGADRVELAHERLRALGLPDAAIQVERLPVVATTPPAYAGAPVRPVRRGHVLLARTVGAVPGAFAGLAITLGAGLTIVPAVLLITAGAAIGMLAVTGRVDRRPRGASGRVLELPHREAHVRVDVRCPPSRIGEVERSLRDAGATLAERPNPGEPERPDTERAPAARSPREDTPPTGLEPAPS
jgi:hypothetical protein